MHIARSVDESIRVNLSWQETWQADDGGLIKCWENGRCIRDSQIEEKKAITQSVNDGELPVLEWIGGLAKALKGKKYGSLEYLATLQGIKGESLQIDTETDVELTCTKTGTTVIYTNKKSKLEAGSR